MNMKLNLQEQREIIRCRRWRQEFKEFFQNKRKQMTFEYKIATIPSFDQVDQLFNYLNDENNQQKSNKVYNFLANKPLVQDIMQKYFKSVDKFCLNIFMICARTIPQTGYEDIFAYAIGLSESHENYHLIQVKFLFLIFFFFKGMKGLCKILHRQLPDETIQKLYNQDIVRNLFKILCQADNQRERSARDYFMRKPIMTLLKYLIQLNRFEKDRSLFNQKFMHILEQILLQVYRNLKDCLIFGPKNKSLPLILVITRNQPALCDTITKEVRQFLRSLLIDKNASDQIILEVLKILITVSSSKNESMAYLFYEENILNILWNFIDHVNLNVRDFIIHIFANYANSRHEGLKGELGSNRELLLRIIAEVKQQEEISQNLIYLLYGLLVNCQQYVDDEILEQQNFLSIFPYKIMQMEYTQYGTEQVILYIISTLIVNYHFKATKEVKAYMHTFELRKHIDDDVKECLDNLYKIIN